MEIRELIFNLAFMETILKVPQGEFTLQRLPYQKNDKLRAWDAADEYLLHYISENNTLRGHGNMLIINDKFGALAVALSEFNPIAISDSWLSQQATRQNLTTNKLAETSVQLRNSLDWPSQMFDVVLFKVPKTLALLEDQLIRLQKIVSPDTVVIAAGMVKMMSSSVWKLMDKYIGSSKPSLAKKKARLIFVSIHPQQASFSSPYPEYYQLENTHYRICNHANVFSRESLDIGTRFLLAHLPEKMQAKNIVDLGCGNGVVGLLLSEKYPSAHLHFVDESFMAVASAKENFFDAYQNRVASFYVTDGLTEFDSEKVDLIVCNPPFHQQNTVGNQIAISLFKQSHRVLKKGGELWVIGNRHLAYHLDLKRLFGNCKEIASNSKFVIWQVIK